MHNIIDFRSDTVTKPSSEMRRAMAEAEVGDDVFKDDPTINRLQEMAAEKTGKQAALFIPSGTMSNMIALKVWTNPGDEVLLDWDAHSVCFEVGGPAIISNVITRMFRSQTGVPDVDDIKNAIRVETLHAPGTRLLVLENTHNRAGGAVIPLEVHQKLYALTQERSMKLHIDGARIFNASVATGIPVSDYAAACDSITFCLSKGLGCPVGSLLCGTSEFIEKAIRVRKLLGGGLRQAGVLAACGIVALETGIDRLAEDHANAKALADAINTLPGIEVDLGSVQTNMVYFNTTKPAADFVQMLAQHNIKCNPTAPNRIRIVVHKDVDAEDIARAIDVFKTIT